MELDQTFSTNRRETTPVHCCFICFQLSDSDVTKNYENRTVAEVGGKGPHSRPQISNIPAFKNFLRYVDIDIQLKGLEEAEFNKFTMCQACCKILDQFSSLFRIWEELDMKLTLLCVDPIERRMRVQRPSQKLSELQETVKIKCLLKTEKYLPSVKAERTTFPSTPPVVTIAVSEEPYLPPFPDSAEDEADPLYLPQEELGAEPEVERKCFVEFSVPPAKNGKPSSTNEFKLLEAAYYKYNGEGPPPSFPLTTEAVMAEARKGSIPIPRGTASGYECKSCGKGFGRFYHFMEHYRMTHLGLYLACRKCDKTYKNRVTLVQHWRLCQGDLSLLLKQGQDQAGAGFCKICRKPFLRLKRHKQEVHSAVAQRFSCDLCNGTYKRLHDLKVHQRAVHLRQRYHCKEPGCRTEFPYPKQLVLHRKKVHMGVGTNDSGKNDLENVESIRKFSAAMHAMPTALKIIDRICKLHDRNVIMKWTA